MKSSFQKQFRRLLATLACLLPAVMRLSAGPVDTTWMAELPVIELTYDEAAFNDDTFIPATFTLHTVDTVRTLSCTVRHRGGTSLTYSKPNFALKFYDEEGESKDVRLLGMRKDNYWILDAMASDYAKMRNRVSMDLWLDFSRPPYHQAEEPNAINGYRGQYVEVWVNGGYFGLFCLMERVDRKQLKLKKFAPNADDSTTYHHRGLLYKAVNGSSKRTPYFLYQSNEPNDGKATYDGMQGEYPDVTEGEPWTWTPLRTKSIYFLAAYSGNYFQNNIGKRFDLPVFNDFMLFLDLLYANDNVGKNFLCWYYDQSSDDQRLGITPWDLDTSWGRDYRGSRVSGATELSNKSNYHTRMTAVYRGYADTLRIRYAELRDTLWQEERLCGYFDRYFALFDSTGVWERERSRWNVTPTDGLKKPLFIDLTTERDYIHHWIHDRLVLLDSLYAYEPPSAIRSVKVDGAGEEPVCYDLMGRRFVQTPATQRKGLYILGRRKLMLR